MSNQTHDTTDDLQSQEKPKSRSGELFKGILLLSACGGILFYVYADYFKFANPPEIESAIHRLEGDLEVAQLVGAPIRVVGIKKVANDAADPEGTVKYEFDIRGHNGAAHVNTAISLEKVPVKDTNSDSKSGTSEDAPTTVTKPAANKFRTSFLKVNFSDGTTKEFDLAPKAARESMAR